LEKLKLTTSIGKETLKELDDREQDCITEGLKHGLDFANPELARMQVESRQRNDLAGYFSKSIKVAQDSAKSTRITSEALTYKHDSLVQSLRTTLTTKYDYFQCESVKVDRKRSLCAKLKKLVKLENQS